MAVSTVSSRIKMVRQKLSITQKEFCKHIFLSHSFYANIERGVRKPNERICELICSRYGVNKNWLISGNGDMFSKSQPDIEVEQLVDLIKGLDPLFKEYIIQQIKQFANLHKKNKDGQNPAHKGRGRKTS